MAQINDIAIDLGTSNVVIYMKGQGVKLREPAVVAVERESRKVIAIGNDAYRMVGRTPGSIQAFRPLKQGEVLDFELAGTMLRSFTANVIGKHIFSHPRAVLSVPTGVKNVEKRALTGILLDAGIRRTQILERPFAAALGAGLNFDDSYGNIIVDMGAGATDIAVLYSGRIAMASCVPIGGDYFDEAIVRYIRQKYNLLIGERTSEQIKLTLGSASPRESDVAMDVTGRNLISGLPKTQTVSAQEVYEALQDTVNDLIEAIQVVIERTPPQLASDIFERGIMLSGGAACLYGLTDTIRDVLQIPCQLANEARDCVVSGCAKVLEDPAGTKKLFEKERSSLI